MNNRIRIFFTRVIMQIIMGSVFCTSKMRRKTLIMLGAKIGKGTFIGRNVYFDPLAIQNISVGDNCIITQNVSILTHFYSLRREFYFGNVNIGDNTFIGMNSLICKPVYIGNNCIVGGAVS